MCSETQFSLRWNNFGSTVTAALNTLQQLGDFVDVTLAVDGMQFKAHKVVLSACSPYFRNILKSNPCQHPVIILREVSTEDFESVLSFMYEGEVNINQSRLHTFMRLAEALQVKGLTDSPSSSYSCCNVNSSVRTATQNVGLDESSASLDLSKKVNQLSSRSELPALPSNLNLSKKRIQNEDLVQLLVDAPCDSPPSPYSNKKIKYLETNERCSPLTESNESEFPEKRISAEGLLEVKLEPDEFQEEGKENSKCVGINVPKVPKLSILSEPKITQSPPVEEPNERASNDSPIAYSHSSGPMDKRSGLPTSRVEKHSNNYHPEFPQDPSCHHTLPYPCPFCEKSYTSWGFRRRHIKGYHTSTPELPCKWCMAVLPSHQDWESHVTQIHSLTITDARNGILILEEAHMVLQFAQPTRIDTLMELIKNKKIKEKEGQEKELPKEGETGKKEDKGKEAVDNEKGKKGLPANQKGETTH